MLAVFLGPGKDPFKQGALKLKLYYLHGKCVPLTHMSLFKKKSLLHKQYMSFVEHQKIQTSSKNKQHIATFQKKTHCNNLCVCAKMRACPKNCFIFF